MIKLPEDFFKPETKLDYHISSEMKQVWAASMNIAQELIDVCQRNGLKCWMDSGTLLGSVRHKGFIPWDDDVDFVMLRKDYDKLVEIADREFKYPYFFQTTYSDKDFYCGHGQLRDVRTTSLGKDEIGKSHCRGITVDIFVLDGYPENAVCRFLQRTATMLLKKSIRGYLSRPEENRRTKNKVRSAISKTIYRLFRLDYKKVFALYEKLFRLVDSDKSRRVAIYSYQYHSNWSIRNRSSYDKTQFLPFENVLWPAPIDTDDCLRCYFGKNYMVPLNLPTDHGHRYMDATMPCEEAEKLLQETPRLFEERLKKLYDCAEKE